MNQDIFAEPCSFIYRNADIRIASGFVQTERGREDFKKLLSHIVEKIQVIFPQGLPNGVKSLIKVKEMDGYTLIEHYIGFLSEFWNKQQSLEFFGENID